MNAASNAARVIVLVHGVPETEAIWTPLISSLAERGVTEVVTLSPPGFGAPLPADFAATAGAYVDWLTAELTELGADRSIDIVGHDWGAGHVYGLVAARPDLVRSWAADIAGLLHPDYRWHDIAAGWQQPSVGEQMIEVMVGTSIAERVELFRSLGLPAELAERLAPALDADMGRAILALYRSAPESELVDVGDRLAAAGHPAGAVITATEDAYVPAPLAAPVAERVGARELVLTGCGHWWMIEDPDGASEQLISFWSSI